MLTDIIKQFFYDYNHVRKFLYTITNSNELKNKIYSKNDLRAKIISVFDITTLREEPGKDFAWISYRIYHPLKMRPLIKSLDITSVILISIRKIPFKHFFI